MFKRFLAAVLLCAAAAAQAGPTLKAGTFDPPRPAPGIALPAADGTPFSLAAHKGKVVILEFGYATCRDVCPISLAMLASARAKLGPLADRLQVVFITVDPERDTPQVLREYLANFDRSFIGITGTPAQMEAIRQAYGISATKKMQARGGYTMGHSSYLYYIDPQGRLRALQPFGRPADDVVHDVKALLE